jgi:hypothetical protein
MMFYLLWPNWGTTLYGEIRGANDFRRVFSGMFIGLWTTVALSVVFLALFAKTFGWSFYLNINAGQNLVTKAVLPIFPYPVMMAGWLVHNAAFQVILILLFSLWFFGYRPDPGRRAEQLVHPERVLAEPQDAVTLPDPGAAQRVGQPVDPLVQRRPGQAVLPVG